MRETQIIEEIRKLTGRRKPSELLLGIGDDCAILRPRVNDDLVFTTDLCIEGRHFSLESHTARDVGHLSLARSLSDLAAMGAEPVFCLASIGIPRALSVDWLKQFYGGFLSLARTSRIALAGGDLSRFRNVVVDVMCCGRVPRGQALTRAGARSGDLIYVTGTLGGSAYGLASRRGAAWRRHLRPTPRLGIGIALRKLGATAAMDLSDGLSLDLQRLCVESRTSAELEEPIPVAKGATVQQALHGGEDYELLFTARPETKVPAKILGVGISRIGAIGKGKAGSVRYAGRVLRPRAFDHFS